ncbi:MAG: hypothetical protein ACH36H_07780 [Candidatus Nanopelagicales bacterium]
MPARPVAAEIDEQTALGKVYLRALIRSQFRLGLATVALVVLPLLGLVAATALWPELRFLQVGPVPLWWLLLSFLVYPAIMSVGWWYVRLAERNEDRFASLVDED